MVRFGRERVIASRLLTALQRGTLETSLTNAERSLVIDGCYFRKIEYGFCKIRHVFGGFTPEFLQHINEEILSAQKGPLQPLQNIFGTVQYGSEKAISNYFIQVSGEKNEIEILYVARALLLLKMSAWKESEPAYFAFILSMVYT